jgi:nucleotide-binding universal stress UspA family protein
MKTSGFSHKLEIMVAVDGSAHSLSAVNLLADLPLSGDSTIYLVTILIPRNASDHARLQAVLDHAQKIFEANGILVSTDLLVGYPSEELTQYARDHSPNLIVLGAVGLRATLGILLGGVAQQMMEYATCPVMIVRHPYESLRRILLVTDGSSYSQKAAHYLANFPLKEDSEVHVIHVLPPLPSSTLIAYAWPLDADLFTPPPSPEAEETLRAQAEEEERQAQSLLEKTQKTLSSLDVKTVGIYKRGDAATEILDYAKSQEIDLIVAGSRGLSRIQGWLLGSVSRKLVHYAQCSVLVVK